jgi:hypothetical protein
VGVARGADRIVVELAPGEHCVQIVRPRLWSAFDRPGDAPLPLPGQVSDGFWFEAAPGGRYVVEDFVTMAQMLDVYDALVSEIRPNGSRQPVGGSMSPPRKGAACHPFRPR